MPGVGSDGRTGTQEQDVFYAHLARVASRFAYAPETKPVPPIAVLRCERLLADPTDCVLRQGQASGAPEA